MMNYLPISEARLLQIQRETEQDESLQVLKAVIQHGWPENKSTLPLLASPYFDMRDELSVQDGLIFDFCSVKATINSKVRIVNTF